MSRAVRRRWLRSWEPQPEGEELLARVDELEKRVNRYSNEIQTLAKRMIGYRMRLDVFEPKVDLLEDPA